MGQPTTSLFERLTAAKRLSTDELTDALIQNHAEKPGFTEATYGQHKTGEAKTSYELLAESITDSRGAMVIDLACGNGPLAELIVEKYPDLSRLVGVDLCPSEIEAARRRVDHPAVEFKLAPAQKIDVPSESFDYVLSHLAFMLFQPIEPVVEEIARVLKPGGKFSAVISEIVERPQLYDEVVQIMQDIIARNTSENLRTFGWGDERTWTERGLKELFSRERGFTGDVEIEPFELVIEKPARELASHLLLFFYGTDLMPPADQEELEASWARCFLKHQEESRETRLLFPLTKISVERELRVTRPRGTGSTAKQ